MRLSIISGLAFVSSLANGASAQALALWDFNDSNLTADFLSVGVTGTASNIGGTTATFATGFGSNAGSAWNTTGYPSSTSSPKTAGVEFSYSFSDATVADDLVFKFDIRHSNTSANKEVVLGSLDGNSWVELASFSFTPAATGTSDTWYPRNLNLTALGDSPSSSLKIRVVSDFGTDTSYLASRSTSTYGTIGTWRFDNVELAFVVPVPEPSTWALFGAGVIGLAFVVRRKNK